MPRTDFPPPRALSRRTFLRGTGVAMALPLLDAMRPALAAGKADVPRRMVAIETNMGILPMNFFPEAVGNDYKLTPYLDVLREHRRDMTIFSGVSHPDVDGGHQAEVSFLTAAPHPGGGGFRNSVSIDQLAAEQIGSQTRFPALTLLVGPENRSLSYTRSGVMIPAEKSPAKLYERMFVQGSAKEIDARLDDLRRGRSLLDFVGDSAKRLERELGPQDRQRIDQYLTSVREVETRMVKAEEWEHREKPKVSAVKPVDVTNHNELVAESRLMYEMIRLALETDSSRLITVFIALAGITPTVPGVSHEAHSLTHHGNRPEVLDELTKIELAQFAALNEFLTSLKASKEGDRSLLDQTSVLYGTCMGSANAHSNVNLPVLLAGGGFKHGQHLAFDTKHNYPLPNLFVSMLQRLGLEVDKFASSTGTMRGLEMT
jgi:Protein of unknown function (DUF1552)